MNIVIRGLIVALSFLILWQLIVSFFELPHYILPSPLRVFHTLYHEYQLIFSEAIPTIIATALGLLLGIVLGCMAALAMTFFKPASFWLLPLLIVSQALPTFAIAPLFVIWFGYGLAAKVMTTMVMLFFPITSAFYDGLRSTDSEWLDLAKSMQAGKWRIFWHVRIPAALPQLASGLRMATAIAPIGAVIGEWVGASQGLGFLMLNANARMQIDLMFAAIFILIFFSLSIYFLMNKALNHFIFWHPKG